MSAQQPIIAVTMGDGAGVGPEIIMKALENTELQHRAKLVVVGDRQRLAQAGALVGSSLPVRAVDTVDDVSAARDCVYCLDLNLLPSDLPFGQLSKEAGHAAFCYLEKAIQLAQDRKIHGICTAPLNKEALHLAGHQYPGHTEILATLTHTQDYAMMLSAPNLRVIHVTTHVGLMDAIARISPERVLRVLELGHDALVRAGVKEPRIAVCGINPHAGEHGLFGDGEEESKLVPAVQQAQARGMAVEGPLPADTVFYRAVHGAFDLVVAMYHDQGHIPVKVLGFEQGVNITVGLPVIRTSVDHGTAFDIAGQGLASAESLIQALWEAVRLAG